MDVNRMKELLREKLLHCSICLNEFADPRFLPCHHTFCLVCISDLSLSSGFLGMGFHCPHCRTLTELSPDEIEGLPVNFYLSSLQDELDSDSEVKCDVCKEKLSQFHCADCDVDVCKFCIPNHRLEIHQKKPNINRIRQFTSPALSSKKFCVDHNREALQIFCNTCQEAICLSCSCSVHKQHDFIPFAKYLQESKAAMEKELNELDKELLAVDKSEELVKRRIEDAFDNAEHSKQLLDDMTQQICEPIMQKKEEIEKEIDLALKSEHESIEIMEEKLEAYAEALRKGQEFLSDLQESEACVEAVACFQRYKEDLKKVRDAFSSSCVPIKQTCFEPFTWKTSTLMDLNFAERRRTFVLGGLGSLKFNYSTLRVDPDTLQVTLKPKFRFKWFFSKLYKILKFLLIFLIALSLFLLFSFIDFHDLQNRFERTELYWQMSDMWKQIKHHSHSQFYGGRR